MDIDNRLMVSELFEEYGCLLTDKQKEALELYCCMDLSLNEIALQKGVSRQAIRDSLAHAQSALFEYEAKLGVIKFKKGLQTLLCSKEEPNIVISKIKQLMED